MPPDELLNVEDVAGMLGVATKTIYRWVDTESIPHLRLGRLLRFSRADITEWLENQKVAPAAPERSSSAPRGANRKTTRANLAAVKRR